MKIIRMTRRETRKRIGITVSIVAMSIAMCGTSTAGGDPASIDQNASPNIANDRRAWKPSDSVAVRYFAAEQADSAGWVSSAIIGIPDESVVPSPDGKYFFFLFHHGDLASDENVYELEVFETDEVLKSLSRGGEGLGRHVLPARVTTLRSTSSMLPAISGARWDADSRGIAFLACSEGTLQDIDWLDMRSGKLVKLTSHPRDVNWFEVRDGRVIFQDRAAPSIRPEPYPVEAVARWKSGGVITPQVEAALNRRGTVYFAGVDQAEAMVGDAQFSSAWMAPDAKAAMALQSVDRAVKFVFFDTTDLKAHDIGDSPAGPSVFTFQAGSAVTYLHLAEPVAYWAPDGTHAILVNMRAPGATRGPVGPVSDKSDAYVADFSVASKEIRLLEPMWSKAGRGSSSVSVRSIGSVSSIPAQGGVVVHYEVDGKPSGSMAYEFREGKWIKAHVAKYEAALAKRLKGLSVQVVQNKNEPPAVVASSGRHREVLTDPDPALRSVARLPVESVQWKDFDGRNVEGGLILPEDNKVRDRPPLVIQASWFVPTHFLPDGANSSSDAAQALAARGLAVLQLDVFTNDFVGGEPPADEGPQFVKKIDAAVAALAARGAIDPARVGLIGFSRAGFRTFYAITHPGITRLAAAICSDSFLGSYSSYLTDAATDVSLIGVQKNYEIGPGGNFWNAKQAWLSYETSFNVNRVRTPALFTLHGGISPDAGPYKPVALQTLGAFLLNDKPMEYLFFPRGNHQLVRPRERIAMMNAAVDWMSFWLQGWEDSDPVKEEQYARWRPMREQLQRSSSTAD